MASPAALRTAMQNVRALSVLDRVAIGDSNAVSRFLVDEITAGGDALAVVMEGLSRLVTLLGWSMTAGYLTGGKITIRDAIRAHGESPPPSFALAKTAIQRDVDGLATLLDIPAERVAAIRGVYGKHAATVVEGIRSSLVDRVNWAIAGLNARNVSLRSEEGRSLIRQAFIDGGVSAADAATKPYLLETLFRTQNSVAFAEGQYQARQNPYIQEILWGYEYVTMGDDRVRENHAAMDGITRKKDDVFWVINTPPNGWNCRCQVVDIYSETPESEIGPREIDGKTVLPVADKGWQFSPGALIGEIAA